MKSKLTLVINISGYGYVFKEYTDICFTSTLPKRDTCLYQGILSGLLYQNMKIIELALKAILGIDRYLTFYIGYIYIEFTFREKFDSKSKGK